MTPKSMPPNDYGNLEIECVLVDQCQKVDIDELLRIAKLELKRTLIQSQLQIEGIEAKLVTSDTGFGGKRLWFECPTCKQRVGTFYRSPLNNSVACRKCLNLKYRCSSKKGMIEAEIA